MLTEVDILINTFTASNLKSTRRSPKLTFNSAAKSFRFVSTFRFKNMFNIKSRREIVRTNRNLFIFRSNFRCFVASPLIKTYSKMNQKNVAKLTTTFSSSLIISVPFNETMFSLDACRFGIFIKTRSCEFPHLAALFRSGSNEWDTWKSNFNGLFCNRNRALRFQGNARNIQPATTLQVVTIARGVGVYMVSRVLVSKRLALD